MLESFFPKPKLFFTSAAIWTLIGIFGWYFGGEALGGLVGLPPAAPDAPPRIGLDFFVTHDFLWFYIYFGFFSGAFCLFWTIFDKDHPWKAWSVWGSALIIFITYFNVQISVLINNWRRPFGDMLQNALTGDKGVTAADMFGMQWIFMQFAFLWMGVYIISRFFISHYIFRWRNAMSDYYLAVWPKVRHIEGASQRIQEDTMRFASIMENLGVSLIDAVMTLIAFLPVLFALSAYVTELPIIGQIPASLFWIAIFWSAFGTALMWFAGIKLPGLEFKNQRVEAAFRKELVYGEDNAERAQPETVRSLFNDVRTNYFRLYFHYVYFNLARGFYIQADGIFLTILLIPTIVSGAITFGIFQQILTAFGQVSNSFQFLVNSWSTIIDLLSIHKRLRSFEAAMEGEPLPEIDQEYLANPSEN
ncbi:peptide antibiotic transporter SbmA [Rhizobium sp. L1K21]|uniref:peptide antibiotic transporter SbmA n=1 Tax=Rhizobium sp. L1K21 TaxID=2954933 RepID=UPI002092A6AF|nr:peptide antibiotic transporter SbmA [Rhizobium sp. L1K21]MCO6185136.1 peptide antibiotic transporter SbmA [Rhizobium sp. L1K21]